MKKFLSTFAVALFTCAVSFSVEIAENELKSVSNEVIVFENYSGPHSKIDTLEAIKGIGSGLGNEVSKDPALETKTGSASKYQIIHALDPEETGKLDADILILGENAEVDHIRNLRHIIASYLSSAYGYSEKDAETIATFVTVYNAVYRSKLDYFKTKYKNIVTKNLTEEKAGLSVTYRDWPGKSQIVIPVSDINGGLSTVDTSIISDKNVVSSMQEEDGKNIEDRKNMVDIKEREADNAGEKAQESAREAAREEKKLKEEQNTLQQKKDDVKEAEKQAEEAQKKAEEAQKKAEEAEKKAVENPKDKEAQKEAKEARTEAEKTAEEAESAEKKAEQAKSEEKQQEIIVEKQKEKTEEAKNTASKEQASADKKQQEAQTERTEIAKDQKKVAEEQKEEDSAPSAYGIRLVNSSSLFSQIVKVNSKTGQVMKESPVKVIRQRSIYEVPDGYLCIAGENKGAGAVKLVIIDKTTLEIVKESEETVSEASVLVKDENTYYCVIKDGSDFVASKYDNSLNAVRKSPVAVNPASPLVITSGGIMATDTKGNPILLKMADLTKVTE